MKRGIPYLAVQRMDIIQLHFIGICFNIQHEEHVSDSQHSVNLKIEMLEVVIKWYDSDSKHFPEKSCKLHAYVIHFGEKTSQPFAQLFPLVLLVNYVA